MKKILLFMIVTLSISLVLAGVSLSPNDKMTLPTDKENFLKDKGIKTLSVVEYECTDKERCFKTSGDLQIDVASIPRQICDKPIFREIKDSKGIIVKKVMTSSCIYRDITDEEVLTLVKRSLDYKIDKMMNEETPTTKGTTKFNPIVILDSKG